MAGAAGYVLKQMRGNDLVDAVRRVAAGQSLLDPAVGPGTPDLGSRPRVEAAQQTLTRRAYHMAHDARADRLAGRPAAAVAVKG